jgi:hypothetical protein
MQDKPAVYKDLMESTNLYNLKGGIGILKESNTSLVQNEHIICIFGCGACSSPPKRREIEN